MGMLARMNPSGEARKNFNAITGAPGKVMDFMREHPVMSKALTTAVSIAFPPARAAMIALEMSGKVSYVLDKVGLGKASDAWSQSDNQDRSLTERVDQFKKKATQSAPRHQMM